MRGDVSVHIVVVKAKAMKRKAIWEQSEPKNYDKPRLYEYWELLNIHQDINIDEWINK